MGQQPLFGPIQGPMDVPQAQGVPSRHALWPSGDGQLKPDAEIAGGPCSNTKSPALLPSVHLSPTMRPGEDTSASGCTWPALAFQISDCHVCMPGRHIQSLTYFHGPTAPLRAHLRAHGRTSGTGCSFQACMRGIVELASCSLTLKLRVFLAAAAAAAPAPAPPAATALLCCLQRTCPW